MAAAIDHSQLVYHLPRRSSHSPALPHPPEKPGEKTGKNAGDSTKG